MIATFRYDSVDVNIFVYKLMTLSGHLCELFRGAYFSSHSPKAWATFYPPSGFLAPPPAQVTAESASHCQTEDGYRAARKGQKSKVSHGLDLATSMRPAPHPGTQASCLRNRVSDSMQRQAGTFSLLSRIPCFPNLHPVALTPLRPALCTQVWDLLP